MVEFAAATSVAIIQLAFLAQTIVGLPIRSAVELESRAISTNNKEKCQNQLSKRSPVIDYILSATCYMRWRGCAPSKNTSQNTAATNQDGHATSHDAKENEHNEQASTATGREPPPDAQRRNPQEPSQAGRPAVKRRDMNEWKARAHFDELDALD
ncbi:hypothetical protein F5887DRAFT_221105 [Amanita rubescens]|nr:hypothetical protein F5887DRAFT_221105 [Amanita rubescens]